MSNSINVWPYILAVFGLFIAYVILFLVIKEAVKQGVNASRVAEWIPRKPRT